MSEGVLFEGSGGTASAGPRRKGAKKKKAAKRGTFYNGPRSASSSNPARKSLPTPRKKAAKKAPAKKAAKRSARA